MDSCASEHTDSPCIQEYVCSIQTVVYGSYYSLCLIIRKVVRRTQSSTSRRYALSPHHSTSVRPFARASMRNNKKEIHSSESICKMQGPFVQRRSKAPLVGGYLLLLLSAFLFCSGLKGGGKKIAKVTWWQTHEDIFLSIVTVSLCKSPKFTILPLYFSIKCQGTTHDLLSFPLREPIRTEQSSCKVASGKKISCQLLKRDGHFFDSLDTKYPLNNAPTPPAIKSFSIGRNWDKWEDRTDEFSPIALKHFEEAKVPSVDKQTLQLAMEKFESVIIYIAHPWDGMCVKKGVVYSDIYLQNEEKIKSTGIRHGSTFFGWMDARENAEVALALNVSANDCRTYIWRKDDNQTAPSSFKATEDERVFKHKMSKYLEPALIPLATEDDITAMHRRHSLVLMGFLDRPMHRNALHVFRRTCIYYRDRSAKMSSAPDIHCGVAVKDKAETLGDKFGVKFGITFFRRHSAEIVSYDFNREIDTIADSTNDFQAWVGMHSVPLFSRFDLGIYSDMKTDSTRQSLPIGLLFLNKSIDRDDEGMLGDESDGFRSVAKKYLGKMRFLWVGRSDFFRLTDFGTSINDAIFPFFAIESNASYSALKYAMPDDDSTGQPLPANVDSMTLFCRKYFENALEPTRPSGPIPKNSRSKWIPGYIREVVWKMLDKEVFSPINHSETLLFLINYDDPRAKKITKVAKLLAEGLEEIPEIMVATMSYVDNYIDEKIFAGSGGENDLRSKLYLIKDGLVMPKLDTESRVKKKNKKSKKAARRKIHSLQDAKTYLKRTSSVLSANVGAMKLFNDRLKMAQKEDRNDVKKRPSLTEEL